MNLDPNLKMPNVNPLEYPTVKCLCGNEIFVPGVIFKDIPGVVLGERENVQVPIKVFYCKHCGELSQYDKDLLKLYDKSEQKTEQKSTIIQDSNINNREHIDIIV